MGIEVAHYSLSDEPKTRSGNLLRAWSEALWREVEENKEKLLLYMDY